MVRQEAKPVRAEPHVSAAKRAAEVGRVVHLSPAERAERGKAARAEVPRASHADWAPAPGRPDPVDLLEQQAATRVPELLPIRYGRMLVSPFTFFRGGALIMASDLAPTPRSGLQVQLCGDAHLSNFGVFGTPERNLVFDINDFDETHPGPWEWDLKRLTASLAVAGRDRDYSAAAAQRDRARGGRGVPHGDARVRRRVEPRRLVRAHGHRPRSSPSSAASLNKRQIARSDAALAKARTKDRLRSFSKLTEVVDGKSRIISDPPLIVPIEELVGSSWLEVEDQFRVMFRDYRRTLTSDRRLLLEQYELAHVARKVVGVGSVGTRAWIALLLGRDDSDPALPTDQGGSGVGARAVPRPQRVRQLRPARRRRPAADASRERPVPGLAAPGARRSRRTSAGLLRAPAAATGRAAPTSQSCVTAGMVAYGRLCAWTLARAHARSGDRIAIASYLGGGDSFDRQSPRSPRRTPTRTSGTTACSPRP